MSLLLKNLEREYTSPPLNLAVFEAGIEEIIALIFSDH
jgi:hypothetical protein